MYRLKNGKCYDLVLTSIKLKARSRQHSSFEVETRYGRGSLSYVNKKKIEWFLIYIQGTQMSVHLESYVQL